MPALAPPSVRTAVRPDRLHPRTRPTAWPGRSRTPAAERCLPAGTAASSQQLAGHDVSQQPRSGHALVDRRLRLGCGFHPRVVAIALAVRAGILLTHMMD